MIKIKYNNKKIIISGHANYDKLGSDIVCASVSSIVYTTINGILNINSDAINYVDETNLVIDVLSDDEIILKLINNMITLLKELELQYPKNIMISKGE